ncbi:hypothetical protein R6Z07F_015471 [Ovis aries]
MVEASFHKVSIRILPVWGDYKRSEGPWVHTRSKAGLRKRIARRSCGSLAASGGLRAHSARSPERTCPVLASEKAGLPQGTASPGGERRVEQGWGRRSAGVALPAARLAAAASRAGAGWVMDGLPARVRAAGRAEEFNKERWGPCVLRASLASFTKLLLWAASCRGYLPNTRNRTCASRSEPTATDLSSPQDLHRSVNQRYMRSLAFTCRKEG